MGCSTFFEKRQLKIRQEDNTKGLRTLRMASGILILKAAMWDISW